MREAEGAETPSPGKSLERAWSKHREPDIRNVEAEVRVPSPPPGKAQVTGLAVESRKDTPSKAGRRVFTGSEPLRLSHFVTDRGAAALCATGRSKWWTRPLNVAGHTALATHAGTADRLSRPGSPAIAAAAARQVMYPPSRFRAWTPSSCSSIVAV